jgi:hypothetical protein
MVLDMFSIAGVVKDQRIEVLDRDSYLLQVAELPEGLCLTITIASDDAVPTPSERQRAYWWAVPVAYCAVHFGTTRKQMHRDLLAKHFGFEAGTFGEAVPKRTSLSMLTAAEMTALIDWVLEWGPTQGIAIPAPEKRT